MYGAFPSDQLLNGALSEEATRALLTSLGFRDWAAALRHLQRMAERHPNARAALLRLTPYLLITLSASADPDQALINLERLTEAPQADEIIRRLESAPRAIEILITIFSGSAFLTEILLRNPAHLAMLTDRAHLARLKTAEQYHHEAAQAMSGAETPAQALDALRRYQRGELLRIGASDLLDLFDLPTVTAQLSQLANGITRAALDHASQQTGIATPGFVVLAMGKLGGNELNYSSDIDLLFLCEGENSAYTRLAQSLIDALASMTAEGFLYRVDTRLRPWGRDGALVTTREGYLAYLARHARLWEKQALLKMRPIAGDLALGEAFRKEIEPHIFGENPETLRAAVHAMKQRTEEILRAKGRGWGEVKLGEGSIRDVEFVVQYLQLAHGGSNPRLRKRATLNAIPRLVRAGLLSPQEGQTLSDGYIFLRTIEHFLQLMHYRQTYTLPADPAAISQMARRLGFHTAFGSTEQASQQFVERYRQHSAAIRNIYTKYITGAPDETAPQPSAPAQTQQHLAHMDASYAAAFSADDIARHAALAAQLTPSKLGLVDVAPLPNGRWRVTIVAYDYLGELSLICGLFFLYRLDIEDGLIFTYEPQPNESDPDARRKIVDVFTVQPLTQPGPSAETWAAYTADFQSLLAMLQRGQRREARSQLARRVGAAYQSERSDAAPLYPIDIQIDNNASPRYTVLRLQTQDTPGFLYEFTNALSLTHTYIARMTVSSTGNRVDDLLYITDENGNKITDPGKQRELRAAAVLIKHFTHLLPRSPNPAVALLNFRDFISHLFQRPNWPDELAAIERPEVLHNLAHLLGVSDFLWADFMRMQYANLFPVVSDLDALRTAKDRAQLQRELESVLAVVHRGPEAPREDAPWRSALNDFKDREMFRIDMRHLLGHIPEFDDFSRELTDLAEVVVNAAYHLTAEDLRSMHGTPRDAAGDPIQMAVLALGKCGGRELGFASDIELMFVYEGEGLTDGPARLSASEFEEKVVQHFLNAIRARQEGIFHVDLQLRPYGKAGSLAVPLESFRRYFAPDGPAWAYERQALVKLRAIAGDEALGGKIESLRDQFIYTGQPFDVTAMRAMREKQVRHLVRGGTFNAKYSPGGLVDVEYLIQGLQITHGAANPALRETNIRKAMDALHAAGILADDDFTRLRKAHTFLRWLIDAMRVVRGNAKDITVPPYGSDEFAFLARRLRYGNDIARLRDDLQRYPADVRDINARLLG